MNPESNNSLDKLIDTANSIREELGKLDKMDSNELNRVEERIRNELQVIQALPDFIGQAIYIKFQERRKEIRKERIDNIRSLTKGK